MIWNLTGYFATYYQNLSNKLNEGATINDIYLLLDAGLNMINNDSLYIEPDTATEHLEMLIAETNLENYRNIFSLINIREYNEAETVLAGIETINSLEDNMSAVIDIYLQSINEDGVLEITEENRASMIGIATQKMQAKRFILQGLFLIQLSVFLLLILKIWKRGKLILYHFHLILIQQTEFFILKYLNILNRIKY